MKNEKELKKRVLLKYASSPLTLLPALAGITTLVGGWAVDSGSTLTLFSGFIMLLVAGGSLLAGIIAGDGSAEKLVIEEIQIEENEKKEKEIQDLKVQLISDGDKRTENALDDLMELTKILKNQNEWSENLNPITLFDIMSKIDELYSGCLNSLKKSFEMFEMGQKLKTQKAKKNILARREEIIEEIIESINKLSEIHDELIEIGKNNEKTDLSNLRKELDINLEVAKNVEDRMKNFDLKDYKEEDFL